MKNVVVLLVILACGMMITTIMSCGHDDILSPKLPNQDKTTLDTRSNNPTVSGHVELDIPDFGVFEKYSFTAVQHSDGSVTGEFNVYDNYDTPLRIVAHGHVICFTIQPDGKTAWLGGVVDQSIYTGRDLAGTEAVWNVVDNGEGTNSPPDEATDLSFGWDPSHGYALNNCENGDSPVSFFGPLVRGNVQVHP